MITKNQKKHIRSLKQKKYRKKEGAFIAEGIKVINEFINASWELDLLFVLKEHIELFKNIPSQKLVFISKTELSQLSFLTTPQKAIAVFKINKPIAFKINTGLQIALDDVNDPGNLGTIIRLCDWFGITNIICSENTVDCYNPKVVQATMGSLTRINITYTNLEAYLKKSTLPVYGTFMNSENIYKTPLPKEGIIVMGNEANGISSKIETLCPNKISIPRFGPTQLTESLNVATATAIILSEFKRLM